MLLNVYTFLYNSSLILLIQYEYQCIYALGPWPTVYYRSYLSSRYLSGSVYVSRHTCVRISTASYRILSVYQTCSIYYATYAQYNQMWYKYNKHWKGTRTFQWLYTILRDKHHNNGNQLNTIEQCNWKQLCCVIFNQLRTLGWVLERGQPHVESAKPKSEMYNDQYMTNLFVGKTYV